MNLLNGTTKDLIAGNLNESMRNSRLEALSLLRDWAHASERYWLDFPAGRGCYGTGYNHWGIQTTQKYVTALAALASCEQDEATALDIDRDWAASRALASLRFSLDSHVSGAGRCTDGSSWGRTWISALGLERMMAGVAALDTYLTDEDRVALGAVMESEADFLLHHYSHGGHKGVSGNLWGNSGRNHPESNQWNGAILWRTAQLFPEHRDAATWKDRAHEFFINAISVERDQYDETIIAGKPVREWHVGANFFPDFALDHHGYFNVGYMAICVSGAAILYHDLDSAGQEVPESLLWHVGDLWRVLRRFVFADGRLARVGGDTRVRYAYCQEYLLPSLMLATALFQEQHGAELIAQFLKTIRHEFNFNGDGSFYSSRLKELAATSPYYYTRLESDRACVLGLLCLHAHRIQWPTPDTAFEPSVAGSWLEPEYGAVVHRCEHRFASFAWRAFGLAQGLCLPPDDGHFAEWEGNLCPVVRFMGDDGVVAGGQTLRRRLLKQKTQNFEGGFLTYGTVEEGIDIAIPEGCKVSELAHTQIVFCALPDGHTVIGLHYSQSLDKWAFPIETKGLHWCLPNDVFNGSKRMLTTSRETLRLESPPVADELIGLGSLWANADDHIGVVGFYGAPELVLQRAVQRRAGKMRTLFVEEICLGCEVEARTITPESPILDCGWAMLSGVTAAQTADFATANAHVSLEVPTGCRGVQVRAMDGRSYTLVANFGAQAQPIEGLDHPLAPGESCLLGH